MTARRGDFRFVIRHSGFVIFTTPLTALTNISHLHNHRLITRP